MVDKVLDWQVIWQYASNLLCLLHEGEHYRGSGSSQKWRGLINIHDLDCTMLHARIFKRVADVTGILTAAVPSIRARMHPYRVARMPNYLRRGHRGLAMF